MKKIITPIILLISIYSCSSSHEEINNVNEKDFNSESFDLIRSDNSFFQQITKDTVLAYDLGKYMEYGFPTDYIAGIYSSQINPLEKVFIYGHTGAFSPCNVVTKMLPSHKSLNVKINDINLNTDLETKTQEERPDFKSMFGKKVNFQLSRSVDTKTDLPDISMVEMYVPEIIEITSPEIKCKEDLYPLCLFNSFLLRWNKDDNNVNGVMIIVEWKGTMIFGEDNQKAYIRSTDIVPDTGETYINPEMFNDIPDTALCTLTILRGNVENELIEDVSCKLVCESHQSIQFVLIKNVTERNEY